MKQIIIATENKGKIAEIEQALSGLPYEFVPQTELKITSAPESGLTFVENALMKARHASRLSGMPAVSDDSGLCVDALGGQPGIYSARWAGPDKDFLYAAEKIHENLLEKGADDYSAYFICVLAVSWPDGDHKVFKGRVDGTLSFPPRGDNGFGYDPIFTPLGYKHTFGEMEPEFKHSISHRNHAFNLFSKELLIEKQ